MSSNSFSGTNYDRWSYEQSSGNAGANDTALNKLQHKFWVAKTKVQRKLGKEEDEHIAASDAELDAKLDLFDSIFETTCRLERLLELYQERLCHLACEENAMGRFLKDHGKVDKTRAGKMMVACGKTMSYSGQQRLTIRSPLVRLHQEVDTFRVRAIQDTDLTVKNMEKARTDYRGALAWMKNVSTELDPDTYKQLEKFRKVQAHVKSGKAKFDRYKLDVLQKVDLLAAARCNMFSNALIMYQDSLVAFWRKTSKTMGHVENTFKGYQPYEFTYIRDLAEHSRQLAQALKPSSRSDKKASKDSKIKKEQEDGQEKEKKDDLLFFDPECTAEPTEEATDALEMLEISEEAKKKADESLQNLLDLGGDEDDELILDIDTQLTEKDMKLLPTLPDEKGDPMFGLKMDKNDTDLLNDLFESNKSIVEDDSKSFSAQWNAMFPQSNPSPKKPMTKTPSTENDEEFSSFISARKDVSGAKENQSDLLMATGAKSKDSSYLPSQLFDLDQSLYSGGRPSKGSSSDPTSVLGDFPMPTPPTPSAAHQQHQHQQNPSSSGAKKADMSQWFSLFADLDPLSNPDAIGHNEKSKWHLDHHS